MGLRLLVIEPSPTDPVGRLGDWLVDAGVDLDVRELGVDGALPADLDAHDGVLVLGGPMGAWDDADAPYLADVRALLRTAVEREVPTLGVCLGHQLLGAANGGRVERNPLGPEIGAQLVAKRSAASLDPLFREVPITPDVIQWHYDAVTVLPVGAIQLLSSPGCEHQAFRLGRLAWGIQFHIETTPDVVRAWAARTEPDDVQDLDGIVERAVAAHDDVAEVWQPFAVTFADMLRDPGSVPAARTVPTSTAAPVTDQDEIRAAIAALGAESTAARASLPTPEFRRP